MATFQTKLPTDENTNQSSAGTLPDAPEPVEDPTPGQQSKLVDRTREFARVALQDSKFAGAVDVDDIEWTVSTSEARSRMAAKSSAVVGPEGVSDREVSLTWAAYEALGWGEQFKGAVLHELAHHVDYARRGESGHDFEFRYIARMFDAPVEVPRFYSGHRLRVFCGEGCESVRSRASKVVKRPDEIHEAGAREEGVCAEHGEAWTVEHVATGRQWQDEAGYCEERAAIEEAESEEW